MSDFNISDGNFCPYCKAETMYDHTTSGIPDDELYQCPNCNNIMIIGAEVQINYYTAKPNRVRLLQDYKTYKKDDILSTKDEQYGSEQYILGSRGKQYIQVFKTFEAGNIDFTLCEWIGDIDE